MPELGCRMEISVANLEREKGKGIGMKYISIVVLSIALLVDVCSAEERLELKDQKDKDSYSLGYKLGSDFTREDMKIDLEALISGIRDAFGGKAPLLNEDEMRKTLMNLQKKMQAAQQKLMKEQGPKNLADGKAFLKKNEAIDGVKTLPSGLQYKVITEGTGKKPKASDTVTVHYRGTLIDGSEFDSSYRRNKPATFRVNGVIPGWTEALQLMKEGAKWKLFIPPNLAYGERSVGHIGPNSTLIFDVELVSVQTAE